MIPLFYTTLPYRLTYTLASLLLDPSYTTLPSLYSTLSFLLSILHYPSFPLSYTAILFLHPELPFFLLSIVQYPSFSLSYTILPSLHPTLHLLLSILHYSSFSLSTGYSTLPSPLHSTLPRKEGYTLV